MRVSKRQFRQKSKILKTCNPVLPKYIHVYESDPEFQVLF